MEAGVKIYSYRVDSVHSETFKVLGGLNRTVADEGESAGMQLQLGYKYKSELFTAEGITK